MTKCVKLELCRADCNGKSCLNCCGEATNLHPAHAATAWHRFDNNCCYKCQRENMCFYMRGKTREDWTKEKLAEMDIFNNGATFSRVKK